jgi:hypothetical protein
VPRIYHRTETSSDAPINEGAAQPQPKPNGNANGHDRAHESSGPSRGPGAERVKEEAKAWGEQPTGGWPEPDMSALSPSLIPAPDFPVTMLGPLEGLVKELAAVKSAPADFVAMSLLTLVGACLGATRLVSPWEGYVEPPVLWVALVGAPSTRKSPAIDAALAGLAPLESDMQRAHKDAVRQYEAASAAAKAADEEWRAKLKEHEKAQKGAGVTPPPERPERAIPPKPPLYERIIIEDSTPQAAARIAAANPRGLCLLQDELTAWLGDFDRYGGNGGDRAFWLKAYGARPHAVDRVKDGGKPIIIDRLSVSLLGAIQPDRLSEHVLSTADDGLAARIVYVYPRQVLFERPRVKPDTERLTRVYRRLRALKFITCSFTNSDGNEIVELRPVELPLEPAAVDSFATWYSQHDKDSEHLVGPIAGCYGKFPGLVLRVAIILEHLWWAAEDGAPEPVAISARGIEVSIAFVDGYVAEMLKRTLGEAAVPQRDKDAATILRAIRERRAEVVNARALAREWKLPGLHQQTQRIEAALQALVEAKCIMAKPDQASPAGGRPRRDYSVNPAVHSHQETK